MTSSLDIGALEVSRKQVRVADDVLITIHFKDFYIIRAGECDYTGLRVWPGAELLAKFMHSAGRVGLLSPSHCVCELGAGVGLSGLVAAKYAQHVMLTDRVPVLLELMEANVASNDLDGRASVCALDWGVEGALALINKYQPESITESETTSSAVAASCSSSTPSSNPDAPASAASASVPTAGSRAWSTDRAVVIAADVVYPDTSDEALVALFATVDTLLGFTDATSSVPAPSHTSSSVAAIVAASASIPASVPVTSKLVAQVPRLTGCFVCSYFSRDAATTKRLLLAAAAADYEPEPIDQAAFDDAFTPSDEGLQGLVICFRKSHAGESLATTEDGLPAFMNQPALRRLWQPAESRAALALAELTDVTEENAFSGLNLDSDSD